MPMVSRSSGTRPMPRACTKRGVRPVTTSPWISTTPPVGSRTPATTSASARWPLPDTPAMPTISPAESVSDTSLRPGAETWESLSSGKPVSCGGRSGGLSSRPHISRASSPLRQALFIGALGHHLPLAHDGDAVGDLDHFRQLVRDEDDAHAARRHGAERREQAFGLLRRQRRRRLVEHQDAGAAHQRLGDLDALLLADGKLAHQPVGIEMDVEVAADCRRAARPPCAASAARPGRRGRPAGFPAPCGAAPDGSAGAPCRCRVPSASCELRI